MEYILVIVESPAKCKKIEQYLNKGTYKIIDDTTVQINELPIGKWTDDYKTFLESMLYEKVVENKNNKGTIYIK